MSKTVAQPGNFSVSGGDSIFPSATKLAAGPVKPVFMAHVFYFLSSVLMKLEYKIDTRLPDAVKIFITDCPFHVKRNSFSSTRNGASRRVKPQFPNFARLKHAGPCGVNSFTPNGPIFRSL